MTAAELMTEAQSRTGLTDFGEDSFREGLEILVRDLREEAELNAVGQVAMPEMLIGMLGQRLQVEDWYRRHPEIDDEPIAAPVIGVGLPRTGSTALSFLLAEDPHARSLRRWEASHPCPPPSTVEGPDPRIEQGKAEIARIAELSPRTQAMLPGSPTGPMECLPLHALEFKAHLFHVFAYVPRYANWILDTDLTSTYRYERRVLKLLQWGCPTRPWRLKSPSHLLFLDDLDQVFPDAKFVWTHRDPAAVILSVADLAVEVSRRFSDGADPRYVGALNIEHWSTGMARAMAFRKRCEDRGEDRFHDIDFRAMQSDPLTRIRELYAWLGELVTPEFEKGMQEWWAEFAENREPTVHPDPATFGIDLDEVGPLFADYTARIPTWIAQGEGAPR